MWAVDEEDMHVTDHRARRRAKSWTDARYSHASALPMGRLEVFCQPPVAAKPGEGSLDDPAPGKQAKASGLIRSLDDGKRSLPQTAVIRVMAIWACHPKTPPYEGRYSDVVPHLSIADQCLDDQQLESIAVEFAQASRQELPIGARATEVTLMDTTSGRWEIRTKLRLG